MKTYFFRSLSKTLLPLLFCGLFLTFSSPATGQDLDVPYVPTPAKVVDRMLDMADVQPSDYVIDLGSGDGRIVIAAAKRGASGHGIDLDPQRIAEARENATQQGVNNQIMFMEANIFDTDFSKASVITMYLLPSVNKKLRPELLDKLEPGTKIVSHSFDMGSWQPDKQENVEINGKTRTHNIFYWVIPAEINGDWQWKSHGKNYSMTVSQEYQNIDVSITDENGQSYDVQNANLQGRRVNIRATNGDQNYIFSGRVEGDKISGIMQIHNGEEKNFSSWSASAN